MAEEGEEKEEKNGKRDLWGKLESFAKISAGVGVLFGSVAIPFIIQKTTDQSHRAQVYMQIMSEREKADTAIRQEMFKTLLTNYLGAFEDKKTMKETEDSFRKRIMFLDLLNLNFQEYLNARPLFEDVYSRLVQAKKGIEKGSKELETVEKLQQELIRVAKNVASRQSAMLAHLGLNRSFEVKKGETVCVRLYAVENLKELMSEVGERSLRDFKYESCSKAPVRNPEPMDTGSPAIDVELEEIKEAAARVKVTPYQESFKNSTLNFVRAAKPINFEVSSFDLPYMDNTRLFDGSRFALVLRDIDKKEEVAHFNAIIFKGEFMSLRDRPFFEEMLQRLSKEGKNK